MPTMVIDARVTKQEYNKLWIDLQSGDKHVEMTAFDTMTLNEIAELVINQEMPADVDKTLQMRYTIEWHTDVEGVRIVDDVQQVRLVDESARDGFESLPGWATWTAQEASDWISTNVTDLPSAITALQEMAQAVIYLRDWRKD